MRGHAGTATLSVSGPLPIDAHRGCRGSARRRVYAASTTRDTSTPGVDVPHDGAFATRPLTLTRPGCYVLSSTIATTNAIPNVRRQGDRVVLAVAPVHVTVAPTGHGVAVAGPLTAVASVTGAVPARLTDVTAGLLARARPTTDRAPACASRRTAARSVQPGRMADGVSRARR